MNLREYSEFKDAARAIGALKAAGRLTGANRQQVAGVGEKRPERQSPQQQTPPTPAPPAPSAKTSPSSPASVPGQLDNRPADSPSPGSQFEFSGAPRTPLSRLSPVATTPSSPWPDSPFATAPPQAEPTPAPTPVSSSPFATPPAPARDELPDFSVSLAERLEKCLVRLCSEAGVAGAMIVDSAGLTLAEHKLDSGRILACSLMLCGTLDRTSRVLDQSGEDFVTLKLDAEQTIGVRRFLASDTPYYLIVVIPRNASDTTTGIEHAIRNIILNLSPRPHSSTEPQKFTIGI